MIAKIISGFKGSHPASAFSLKGYSRGTKGANDYDDKDELELELYEDLGICHQGRSQKARFVSAIPAVDGIGDGFNGLLPNLDRPRSPL